MYSKEFLSNGPYASYIGLSIIKLLGTELLISHTFQCERYFSFACLKISTIRMILLGTVPYAIVSVGDQLCVHEIKVICLFMAGTQ